MIRFRRILVHALLAGVIFNVMPANAAGVRKLIKADDMQIEAFIFGKGAQTLIMAAGNGRPAEQLNALAEKISRTGYRVVTYNYRTLGASTGKIDGITLHDYASDVWRVADGVAAKKVFLAGKTYGNRVMRAAAQDRPDRVLGVILIGAGGEIPPSPETIALYQRYLDPETPKDEWRILQGQLMYAPGNEHLAEIDSAQGEFPVLAAAQAKSSEATPNAEWEDGGSARMLILTCLFDRVAIPEGALQLAKKRANAWLIALPDCAHNMLNEQPDELQHYIVDFMKRPRAAAR